MSKKEQILRKHFCNQFGDNGLGEFEDCHNEYVYKAMQKYAEGVVRDREIELRESFNLEQKQYLNQKIKNLKELEKLRKENAELRERMKKE